MPQSLAEFQLLEENRRLKNVIRNMRCVNCGHPVTPGYQISVGNLDPEPTSAENERYAKTAASRLATMLGLTEAYVYKRMESGRYKIILAWEGEYQQGDRNNGRRLWRRR